MSVFRVYVGLAGLVRVLFINLIVLVVSVCVICLFSAMNLGLLVLVFRFFFHIYGNTPLDSEYWGFLGLCIIAYSIVS